VQVGDAHLDQGVLAGPQAEALDLLLAALVHLLDAVRVDPAVEHQLLQGDPAISRRTGSKQEQQDRFGVSSMIRLTPVTDSKARMLRPSRPMIRPFISSAGQVQHADHALRGLLAGDPLDRVDHDGAGPLLAVRLSLGLDVADEQCGVPLGPLLDRLEQLDPGVGRGEPAIRSSSASCSCCRASSTRVRSASACSASASSWPRASTGGQCRRPAPPARPAGPPAAPGPA
jgi:hypothetical protein